MLADLSLAAFLERCGAREPVPGGGAVAAALLALGASMGEMAGRYSDRGAHADAVARVVTSLARIRGEALGEVDGDAAAFAGVGAAQSLPRGSDDEKAARREAVQSALVAALRPPRRVLGLAREALQLTARLQPLANPRLASDVAVAAHALGAAARSAALNVRANLGALPDAGRVECEGEVRAILIEVERLEARVAEAVARTLGA